MKKRVETNLYKEKAIEGKFDNVEETIEEVREVSNIALESANGKNKVFHQPEEPTGTDLKVNDTWFDTNNGYKMYTWNGGSWVAEQLGTDALADLSITNGKIADATITNAKIQSIDAGKITTGILSAITIEGVDLKLGGKASTIGDGSMEIYDSTDTRIARWDKSGLYIGGIGTALTDPTFSINTMGELKTVEHVTGSILGITDLTTEVRSGGLYQETTYESGWHDNVILNNGFIDIGNYDDSDNLVDEALIHSTFIKVLSFAYQGREDADMEVSSSAITKGRTINGVYEQNEYVDALLLDDTDFNPVTEFESDSEWDSTPSQNILGAMLVNLLHSSSYVGGERAMFEGGPYAAYITNANKELNVFFPYSKVPKWCQINLSEIVVPSAITGYTTKGLLNNASSISGSSLIVSAFENVQNGLKITFTRSNGSAFTNVTTDTPIAIQLTGYLTVLFRKPRG